MKKSNAKIILLYLVLFAAVIVAVSFMFRQEELKSYPWGAVWQEYCERCGVCGTEAWYDEVVKYENEVLSKR